MADSNRNAANRSPSIVLSETCPAYVLAGGQSSRFGSDKGLVEVDGQPLLMRLCHDLRSLGHSVFVVADRANRYGQLGIECVPDETPGRGPLAGLAAALQHCQQQTWSKQTDWILLLTCDQLRWRASWFEELSALASEQVDAVVFRRQDSQQPRLQPLPGLVSRRLLSAAVNQLQSPEARQWSLRSLLANSQIAEQDTRCHPQDFTFNTPAELEAILWRKNT